jgi:GGDEF domain-containing protein
MSSIAELDTQLQGQSYLRSVMELGDNHSVVTTKAIYTINHVKLVEPGTTVNSKLLTHLIEHVLDTHGVGGKCVVHQCSASIGVVVFVADESSQTNVLEQADSAMYQAKQAGKNTVCFYKTHTK